MPKKGKKISIMDVTVRDGSYLINYSYTPKQVARIAHAVDEAGIDYIEVSHGCGLGAGENTPFKAAASDLDYVKAAKSSSRRIKVGVIAGSPPITLPKDITAVIDEVDFIRFAANCDNPLQVKGNLMHARRLRPRLPIFFQMMRSTRIPRKAIVESARKVEDMGVDTLYIVDTNGSFLPDEVFETISALTDKLDIKIGFHGHNNFSLAIANSLAAIEAGAVVVDASLKGIGRSAGNAQLEILVSILKRRGLIKKVVDLDALLIAADTIVLPIISAPKGMSSIEIITADGNIDVYPYSIYERVAYEAGLNFIDFIYALGRDKKTVEADMPSLKRVLARLKKDADLVLSKAGLIAAKEPPKRPRLRPKKKIVAALSLLTEAQHPYSFREEMASPLIKEFPGVDFRVTPIAELKGLEEAKILFSYALTQDMLSAMPMLKWFNSTVTGPDKVLFPEVIERRIKITTPRGLHSIPISETVVGLMLCLSRKLKECILSQSRGVYDPMAALGADPPMRELSGSTAVIIGLGGIGNAVAVRCKSLAMSVVAVVPSPRPSPSYVDVMLTKDRLCEALPAADFLILACPLTHETRGMIGKGELSSMKRDSFVINCARGELWDEGALMAALNSGAIGGAAADAFAMEPLPDGHPFFSTRNMIITPHVSGISTRYWGRTLSRFSENLRCYLNGEELIGLVDLKKGY